ncbi:MAG: hypothetical protein MUC43_11195 [Pirellula sp.]|jgi:hypothetical protein|nr:hypothetical protein [Pirellula sp.]
MLASDASNLWPDRLRAHVAEVAKTLEAHQQCIQSVARSATSRVAEVAKTLEARQQCIQSVARSATGPCSRSRQDFGTLASNASNLWPDRLRAHVAEVAKTLEARQRRIQSVARSATGHVAEVAKTLERSPAMHPICGQIGYEPCSRSRQDFGYSPVHAI